MFLKLLHTISDKNFFNFAVLDLTPTTVKITTFSDEEEIDNKILDISELLSRDSLIYWTFADFILIWFAQILGSHIENKRLEDLKNLVDFILKLNPEKNYSKITDHTIIYFKFSKQNKTRLVRTNKFSIEENDKVFMYLTTLFMKSEYHIFLKQALSKFIEKLPELIKSNDFDVTKTQELAHIISSEIHYSILFND